MQLLNLSTIAAISFIATTSASPLDPRACQVDVTTTHSACINEVPVGVDGAKDSGALTRCSLAAVAGYNLCPGAEKRDVAITPCETHVVSAQTSCIKDIPTSPGGGMDPDSIRSCTSVARKGLSSCIGTVKRDVKACADAVTAKQGECLLAAGTNQKKVSKCSDDAQRGFVACV